MVEYMSRAPNMSYAPVMSRNQPLTNRLRMGPRTPTQFETVKKMSIRGNLFQRMGGAKGIGQTILYGGPEGSGQYAQGKVYAQIAGAIVPETKAVGAFSKIGRFIKNVFNPFSFTPSAFIQRAVTSTSISTGSNILAGRSPLPSSGQLRGSLAYTVGGLPAFVGGTYLKAKGKGQSVVSNLQQLGLPNMTPNNPITGPIVSKIGDLMSGKDGLSKSIPTSESAIPSSLSATYGSSPSVSIGGGGFDPSLLLLLLGGGLLGGYALGRRKRKKKRNKKRRNHRK